MIARTERQRMTMQGLIDGFSMKEIAYHQKVDKKTISSCIGRMKERVKARTTYQLVAMAAKES